jgi:hypothetical protein
VFFQQIDLIKTHFYDIIRYYKYIRGNPMSTTGATAFLLRAAFQADPERCSNLIVSNLNKRIKQAALIAVFGGLDPDKLIHIPAFGRNHPEVRKYEEGRSKLHKAVCEGSAVLHADPDVAAMVQKVRKGYLSYGAHPDRDQKEEILLTLMKKMDQAIKANEKAQVIHLAQVVKYLFSGEEIMGKDALLGRVFGLFCEHSLGAFLRKHGVVKQSK